jgi:hypothetical protein
LILTDPHGITPHHIILQKTGVYTGFSLLAISALHGSKGGKAHLPTNQSTPSFHNTGEFKSPAFHRLRDCRCRQYPFLNLPYLTCTADWLAKHHLVASCIFTKQTSNFVGLCVDIKTEQTCSDEKKKRENIAGSDQHTVINIYKYFTKYFPHKIDKIVKEIFNAICPSRAAFYRIKKQLLMAERQKKKKRHMKLT